MSLLPGTRFGPYEILSPLGAGGMGEVYKARDTRLGREVAVKVLPAEFATDPERLRRFEQEARATAALDHPNILAVFDIGTHDGTPYIVEQLLEGESLRQRLRGGPLSPAKAVEFGIQIASGLAAAHEKGIVHRDLKPENLFVTKDGRIKILDFGLARLRPFEGSLEMLLSEAATADSPTREGKVLGTPSYMSPEQAQGQLVDVRSDVFSLGIILYEMATGRRPFEGDTAISVISSILRDTPAPVTQVQPSVPSRLNRIIARCLEKNPASRYPDGATLRDDLVVLGKELAADETTTFILRAPARRWFLTVCALATILAAVAGLVWHRQTTRERWVEREALPKLQAISNQVRFDGREAWDAYLLAKKVDSLAPGHPLVEQLRSSFSREVSIVSDPPGAVVSIRYYDEPDSTPIILGKTPLNKVQYPRGFTLLRLTLPGHVPLRDLKSLWGQSGITWSYQFPPPGLVPDGMSFTQSNRLPEILLAGLNDLKVEPTVPIAMDRHEVTNADFKRFVDAGGYTDPKYWKQPFIEGGRQLPWMEAMARFMDRTGRPGPATWEVGTCPDGRDQFPVSGVSWYEAAAYAEWAGKSLPTIYHWNEVAYTWASAKIVPLANMRGNGPVPVGSTKSENRFGVYDLAGNVREWIWNACTGREEHFILGGGWNDPAYAFEDAYAQPAFDRSPTNGFRCIKYLQTDPNLSDLQKPIQRKVRDFKAERPASDAVFAQYLRQFTYDRSPLDARIEEEKSTTTDVRQKITFNAAYGNERVTAYLFLPAAAKPPYQVVVFFPGSEVISQRSSSSLDLGSMAFVPKSGRALLWPIYKGTFERGDDSTSGFPSETAAYRDHVIMWVKDLARSIDYLETRRDIDCGHLAYFGWSWGGLLGAILPAAEKRIKANVLVVAGLPNWRAFPEVDSINYVTRVKQPTLMLNGELDFYFPQETCQRPMYELLGTPPSDKKWLVYPGGHFVPHLEIIRESLAWLDRYLGPVEQKAPR